MSSPVKTPTVKASATIPPATGDERSPTLAWLERHQKPLSYGAVILAVVLLGGWFYMETGKRKAIAGNDALDRARAAFESGNLPAASTEFQRIAQSFGGTDAGFQAELALNEVRLTSGQAQLAVDELRKFAERNPPAFYGSGANLLMGAGLENLGKYDEAVAAYRRAAELAAEDYRQIEALVAAARASRLAGKETEAVEILRGVVSKYPTDTPGVAEAEVRLAEWTRGKL
jgi:tetratricopeptide (TPR) repeat protein